MVRTGERLVGTEGSSLLEQRCAEIHVTNLQRFAPCQARSGEATISAAPWYRVGGRSAVDGGVGILRRLTSRVGDHLRRRRFPRPTWRKSCLSVQSGHVGTGADGSPAGGSGSGGLHSDDRRLRLNVYGRLKHAHRCILRLIPPPNGSPRCAIPTAVRCGWHSCIRLPVGLFPISCADFGVQRRGSGSPSVRPGVRDGGVPGARAR